VWTVCGAWAEGTVIPVVPVMGCAVVWGTWAIQERGEQRLYFADSVYFFDIVVLLRHVVLRHLKGREQCSI
jgi:hypothetical protein